MFDGLGIRLRGFHQTRHTFGQLLVDQGEPIEKVSASMRHEDVSITLKVYYKSKALEAAGAIVMQLARKAV
jgi:integrase